MHGLITFLLFFRRNSGAPWVSRRGASSRPRQNNHIRRKHNPTTEIRQFLRASIVSGSGFTARVLYGFLALPQSFATSRFFNTDRSTLARAWTLPGGRHAKRAGARR